MVVEQVVIVVAAAVVEIVVVIVVVGGTVLGIVAPGSTTGSSSGRCGSSGRTGRFLAVFTAQERVTQCDKRVCDSDLLSLAKHSHQ